MIKSFRKFFQKTLGPQVVVGSDLVWVPDVESSVHQFGERYLKFIFTSQEIAYCRPERDKLSCLGLAARFAAKEATMKLLRPGRDQLLPWRSIEVVQCLNGAPNIRLHEPASQMAKVAGIDQINLSMSHDRDYATAVVVAIGRCVHK